MPRGAVSAVCLTAALSLALTACSSSSGPAPAGSAAASGGSLVVGVTSDPDTLFPWKATQFTAVNVLQNLYGTLTEFDKDLNVVPGLAESWQPSEDGKKLTLKLRQGVTFADGSAFDSKDVKASLDKIMDEKTAAVARASLASVKSVEAPDASTVVLELTGPDAALPANLATVNMAMLSSDDTEEKLTATPNGTGPFTLGKRVASQSITLTRNDRYWGAEKPKVASVEFRVIPDESSIVSAMQSGNVQLAVFNDPLVAQTAEGGGTITVTKTPQLNYHVLQLNAQHGDLKDVNVRLAIQCAIDRKQVLDTAALGEGEVTGPITAPAFKSDPNKRPCPNRDLAKAAEYLGKAGKSGGVTVKTIVSQGEYATSVNEAQNLKAQLAEAKINLELEVLESGAFVDRWVAADFDAAVALNGGRPDPDGSYGRYFTSKGNLNKVAGYSSPELDELFAQGKATTDQAARKAVYDKIGAELENNAAWIWLFAGYTYTATTANVSGFTPMASGSLQYLRTTAVR
ncbi:Dipeptide-binding ABC transporter, periplasmic substrate-binding component (TC 3.A.1.5.2) [[Actinomadura] parvosata subsp. kistnae]|uniref:ABC transporter substrate-binding protein n=1 Tax=[Actinomadura] parvosata subsp. kistnae TaxID=1909395 RepID=A0A1U9ZSM3_9ACTN|nr:ABC transporter substrate-binding protein [Nonomuraea sp. ATCC 55076]AQZ60942.1 ABC transporter substrate-binding protein [Nonomuraea sp. ATCC 55076]SPL90377.1 Dipeptide-binding ABC transporter, periplasmic substrate-binding component (TC 3.A.1.5.2) [Actinomadura parvosata subsp. kistnae]